MQITIRDLAIGYTNDEEEGVRAYGGKLDIRPPYQRNFVYDHKKRDLVIDSVINNFPLNVMYWHEDGKGNYEIIDGQQRTLSICEFIDNNFGIDDKLFARLPEDIRERILDYKLDVYKCNGTESEKLNWFERINVAGEVLTKQELLNAIYSGTWTTDAKKHFSKSNCNAESIGKNFLSGKRNRQDYLATVLSWISNDDVKNYMNLHCGDSNASELWSYFEAVIEWSESLFIASNKDIRAPLKHVPWGLLYNEFKDTELNGEELRKEVNELYLDDDVTRQAGIYSYVLTREEKHLSIRSFSDLQKQSAYEAQGGKCANDKCGKECSITEMHADHKEPWSLGGKTLKDNLQMLCKSCNLKKSNII